jgi:hypothetical protein
MAGKFYFTLREDAMALMIYRLCISCFQEGMDAWTLFQANKQHADKDMMKEFEANLKSLGMDHLHKELFGEENNEMAVLSTKKRKSLSKDQFAIPETKSYPIPDRAHAANALARVSQFGSPAERAKVRAAVKKKFPDMPSVSTDKKKKKKAIAK